MLMALASWEGVVYAVPLRQIAHQSPDTGTTAQARVPRHSPSTFICTQFSPLFVFLIQYPLTSHSDYYVGRAHREYPIHKCHSAHPLTKIGIHNYDLEGYWLMYMCVILWDGFAMSS